MRSRLSLVWLVLAVIGLVSACVAEPEDVRAVNDLVDTWINGWVADDLQGVAAVFTADGVLTDFDNIDHVGRDQIVAQAATATMRPIERFGATEPIDPNQDYEGYFVPVRFSDGNAESWFILAVLPEGHLIARLVQAIETSEEPPRPSFLERLPGLFGSLRFLVVLVVIGIVTAVLIANNRVKQQSGTPYEPSTLRRVFSALIGALALYVIGLGCYLIVDWTAAKGPSLRGSLEVALSFLLIAIPLGWAAVRLWIGPQQ